MKRTAILIFALAAAISAIVFAPLHVLVKERKLLAQRAVEAGVPSIAVTLLRPLAGLGDVQAANNLGALLARGAGVYRDREAARKLFARAAAGGSVRARVNVIMMDNGRCGLNLTRASDSAALLDPLGASDPAAASLALDCLYFDAVAQTLPDRNRIAADAGKRVAASGNSAQLLHAGEALLSKARGTPHPHFSNSMSEQRHRETVVPLARQAMQLLFAAADAGAAGAYEPLGILSMQFGRMLGDDPLAVRLREKGNWEWLETGAEHGDWSAQCRVAGAKLNRLRFDEKPYTRETFDAAVKAARECIERKEIPQRVQWHAGPEWLVVAPAVARDVEPVLEIESTAALLRRLQFFEADRKVQAASATSPQGSR